jgi:hypothetical protein
MSWAARRRLLILGTIGVVVLIVLIAIFYKTFTVAPTCSDGIQNQGEQGIDCGGPCPYLCTALEQTPVVEFTQALQTPAGLTDVIAYIQNPNLYAYTLSVPYTLSLYSSENTLAAPTMSGTIALPPGAIVPVFIPNISSGKSGVTSAFLTIDPSVIQWQSGRDTRIIPTVSNTVLTGSTAIPRITSMLTNPSTTPLSNIKVVVAVFNASGNVIAASQTVVPSIPAQGSATATFTWNTPFPARATRIDVIPVIPLL